MILENLEKILREQKESGQLRIINAHENQELEGSQLKESAVLPIDFYSNDYLSITINKDLRARYLELLASQKGPLIGASGVRTTSGNTAFHTALERKIARFHGSEAALLFNSGFDANYGVLSSIPQKGDAICFDELSHASVREGIRASRAGRKISFKHNDLKDLTHVLELLYKEDYYKSGERNIFVCVETLYSMDGDMAPLPDLVSLMRLTFPNGNCYLITDEAHATGVFGQNGRGLANASGTESSCFLQMHTFSKGLGSIGAVVLCPAVVRTYLINFAKSFRYSTSQPKINLLAVSLVYDFLGTDERATRAHEVLELAGYMRQALGQSGFGLVQEDVPVSPIICIRVAKPRAIEAWLDTYGFAVTPVTFPVVPLGTDRLRVCLHAANTRAEIDAFMALLQQWSARQARL